jgi:hypothetical protein
MLNNEYFSPTISVMNADHTLDRHILNMGYLYRNYNHKKSIIIPDYLLHRQPAGIRPILFSRHRK